MLMEGKLVLHMANEYWSVFVDTAYSNIQDNSTFSFSI